MRLQYVSDIHLERLSRIPKLQQVGSHLALIGDIGDPYKYNYKEFLTYASYHYEHVFLVSGNHEYWTNNSISQTDNCINLITSKLSNVTYLNNKVTKLNNYDVVGSTLWTSTTYKVGNDTSIRFLNTVIDSKTPKIVLTHYIPSYSLNSSHYKQPIYKNKLKNYCNDLDHLIQKPIKHWLCGHSHCNIDMNINGVHCAINANHSETRLTSKYITLT